MPIDLQQLMDSPLGVRVIALLAAGIPGRIGYPLCDRIGRWLAAHHDLKLTQAVRLNQWVVRGANPQDVGLDRAIRETLQNNARDIYTLYHFLHRPKAMQQMIRLSPEARDVFERPEFSERGLVILGLHLSNFDFVLRSIFQQGFRAMVLTIPDPQGGRRVEYEMRKQTGMDVVPASVGALLEAVRHLENGGMLISGLDRPVPEPKLQPRFFGRPAALPTHYVYLACKARVPVVVMATIQQPDGKYDVLCSPFIKMETEKDSEKETLLNAERVLHEAEIFIRMAPQQWNVPLPVWTHLLAQAPKIE
jgi:KDO2-lipid IV(A) lauroyltransferase